MPVELANDIEIVVLTHKAKPAPTIELLGTHGIPFRVHENPDRAWPAGHPELVTDRSDRPSVRGYALRQYRAFQGHQDILRSATTKHTMVMEDDVGLAAGVEMAEVIQLINAARDLLDTYEAVSLHGRKLSREKGAFFLNTHEFIELGRQPQLDWGHRYFLKPVRGYYSGKYDHNLMKWHEGALAYLISQPGRDKWLAAGHGFGLPCDLFLANELSTAVMKHSVFLHDERHGSIIANTGSCKRELGPQGSPQVQVSS